MIKLHNESKPNDEIRIVDDGGNIGHFHLIWWGDLWGEKNVRIQSLTDIDVPNTKRILSELLAKGWIQV